MLRCQRKIRFQKKNLKKVTFAQPCAKSRFGLISGMMRIPVRASIRSAGTGAAGRQFRLADLAKLAGLKRKGSVER